MVFIARYVWFFLITLVDLFKKLSQTGVIVQDTDISYPFSGSLHCCTTRQHLSSVCVKRNKTVLPKAFRNHTKKRLNATSRHCCRLLRLLYFVDDKICLCEAVPIPVQHSMLWLTFAETDVTLASHLINAPKNVTYISHSIQNELIELCGNHIIACIVKKAKEAIFFSVFGRWISGCQ